MRLLQKLFRRRKKISDERMAELSKAYWEWCGAVLTVRYDLKQREDNNGTERH